MVLSKVIFFLPLETKYIFAQKRVFDMTRINTKGLFLILYNLKRLCNNQSVPEGPRFLVQISAKFVNKRE